MKTFGIEYIIDHHLFMDFPHRCCFYILCSGFRCTSSHARRWHRKCSEKMVAVVRDQDEGEEEEEGEEEG